MEEAQFNRSVVPLRERMYRYAHSLLLSADEAADVTHDLLERLWRDRRRLDERRNVAAFVLTAVRNLCYDRLRQQRAGREREQAILRSADRTEPGAAEAWEARDLVRRGMATLPHRQREVLHLKDIEGYPTREIAELVGCDEAQVRTLLSRARSGLREALKRMMNDDQRQRKD